MAWIGVADTTQGRFRATGLGDHGPDPETSSLAPDTLVARGSILLETRLAPEGRPQTLLAFSHNHPWTGSFSMRALPGGAIVLAENCGDDLRHAVLQHDVDARSEMVRITYSWDAPNRWARLTLEHLASDRIFSKDLPPPHPMLLADLRMIARYPTQRAMDRDVSYFALADHIHPIGPMPGLTSHAPVATPHGYMAAGHLKRGDTVITDDGEVAPVLQTVKLTVPAYGHFRPVRLRAPFFGLRQDILIAPHQRLVMGGSQVEYMFGTEAVLIPARHLVNRVSAFHADGPDLVTYHHLLLPEHKALIVAECPIESLYIGRLRRKPVALAASLLARFERARLPEHARPVWPVLKPIEAITLAQVRAA